MSEVIDFPLRDLGVDEHQPEFKAYGKTPRLNKVIHISEKLDGTNGAIIISKDGRVAAQSRNRIVTPGKSTDNHGFASFVYERAGALRDALGVGHHYGEFVGRKIGRGYDVDKTFYLFNPRHAEAVRDVDNLEIVPQLLAWGNFNSAAIDGALQGLVDHGSYIDQNQRPEGIIVFHSASKQVYKVLTDADDIPKSVAERHLKAVA